MKELYGWYAYSWAAEPFVVSAIATYVPLFLEQIARSNAVWAQDHTTPCLSVPVDNPGLAPVPIEPPQCVVRMFWGWIDTSSLPLYTFSFSVLVQTLLVISISGIADKGTNRKRLLVRFAVLGSFATIAFYFVTSKHYYVAALLAVIANSSFGAVSVCGNSYLRLLVDAQVNRAQRLQHTISDRFASAYQYQAIDPAPISTRTSGAGVAVGYLAALIVQITTMFILYRFSSGSNSVFMLQVVTAFVGVWWLVWQIPVMAWLPSDDHVTVNQVISPPTDLWGEIWAGWHSLLRTFAHARKLRDISTFLLGWFVISDAVVTINSTAILFARGNLQMATPSLAGVGLLTVLFGIVGSLLTRAIKFRNPVYTLLIVAFITAVIPFYGCLGFFSSHIGLKHPWEMFLLAAWYGIALGALNTICRSVYSLLIPRGHETMFFALFSVTDKGSSVIGPAVTGIITDRTHNIRYTFYFLLFMTLLAAFVFSGVDIERGQRDAVALGQEIDEEEAADPVRLP